MSQIPHNFLLIRNNPLTVDAASSMKALYLVSKSFVNFYKDKEVYSNMGANPEAKYQMLESVIKFIDVNVSGSNNVATKYNGGMLAKAFDSCDENKEDPNIVYKEMLRVLLMLSYNLGEYFVCDSLLEINSIVGSFKLNFDKFGKKTKALALNLFELCKILREFAREKNLDFDNPGPINF